MGRTTLFLATSGDIEMYDDVSTPLNFSIADIRSPEKRNGNYSKTIKIPGTKNNNLIFGNIFDINISNGSFNPNIKVKAQLIIDDEEQINGYLQLLNIIINDDSKIEYEVIIIGNVGNIFNELGNSLLTDLDFSEYNHTYDYATQVASWSNTYLNGYVYPLIDYGFDNDLTKINVEHLFPALFLKVYIVKILNSANYTYTSAFFDSAFFQKLIIPTNALKLILTDAQIQLRLFEATQTAPIVKTLSTTDNVPRFDVIYNNEVSDVSGLYNNTTGVFTVANRGYYSFSASGNITYNTTPTSGTMRSWADEIFILRSTNGGASYSQLASTYNGHTANGTFSTYVGITNIYLNAGDKIKIAILYDGTDLGTNYTGTITINGGSFSNMVVNNGLLEDDTLDVNTCIPVNIKQKDFLLSVIKMFNLYVDIDRNNDKNLIIEPRDDFYAGGTNIDWTYKLDNSKDIEYHPMGDLDFKEFIYNYTEDNDFFNKKYKDTYLEVYGRYRNIVNNEFLTGTNETKIIFSPTPLVGDNSNDRIIPRIWDVDNTNIVRARAFNIRILYLGGIKTSNVSYQYNGQSSGVHIVTDYLYAGHLDNPASPTLDLSFGIPREVYYDATSYTNNNLYNKYHKKFIEEITDSDSKIATGYFYLKPSDIRNIDFRNQFYFENQYFRLNKIYDYDPLKHETTRCEFIKIKDAGTFTTSIFDVFGGAVEIGDEIAPLITIPNRDTYNNIIINGISRSLVTGNGNILDSNLRGIILQGNSNIIGNSTNVALLGSSGDIIGSNSSNILLVSSSGDIIGSNTRNVTLINTSDITVNESNVTYIGGNLIVGPVIDGIYGPTLFNTTNVSSSISYKCQWMRIRNTITVSGKLELTATTTGLNTVLGISLPISTSILADEQCAGTAFSTEVSGMGAGILGSISDNRANLQFIASSMTSHIWAFTFTYSIA